MNSPRNNYRSLKGKIITSPLSLVKAVNKVLKNGSGIPENFNGLIESISDISKNGLKVCMLFILRGTHLDLVESFIELSVQNGNPLGIDLHANVPDHKKTLLEYSITSCNYEIFSKLLPHYEISKDRGHIINHIIFSHSMSPKLTTSEIAVREMMLTDCLEKGFVLRKSVIVKLVGTNNSDYLIIIGHSKAGKKILTEDFLDKLSNICKIEQNRARKVEEVIVRIKKKILSENPYLLLDQANNTFPEIINLETLGLDINERIERILNTAV